jgi:hypothetical protein
MNKTESCKEYKLLMTNAKVRNLGDENHHTTPRLIGGTKTVELTVEEHIKAHELLMNITFGTRFHIPMATAYFLMCNTRYFSNKVDMKSLAYAKKKFVKRMTGRKVSEETKAKLREARARQKSPRPKGYKMSEETKRKIGMANKGEKNGMYGKKLSYEHKQKIIERNIDKILWNKGKKGIAAKKQWKQRKVYMFSYGKAGETGHLISRRRKKKIII